MGCKWVVGATTMTPETPEDLTADDLEEVFSDEYELYTDKAEIVLTVGHTTEESASITHLWVDPDHRGEGWGSACIQAAEELIRQKTDGEGTVGLIISVQNPGGTDEFLQKQGFRDVRNVERAQFDNPVSEGYKPVSA